MSKPMLSAWSEREFRRYFPTRQEHAKAMARAIELEKKGCPRRAWRVRLNLDHIKNIGGLNEQNV
jgi:hypothetical protein